MPRNLFAQASALALIAVMGIVPNVQAQLAPNQTAAGTSRPLKLAKDSPFRDPDLIYLEADELINDENASVLTAIGEVEGRYQDRTLRANRVDYNLETGQVLATGDVVLIDATGDVQYADKLELSDQLQAGTAANFTARLASGATTAARFVTRSDDGEFELFNVTYTACELCKNSEGKTKNPTWRLRARRVKQDDESRTIRYRDAVLELFGLPIFYTPYLAHPDPSQDRASGLLVPTIGMSGARGFNYVQPYYWAIDDYSEITVTPHIYSSLNPLLELQARRKLNTGDLNFAGSFTRATVFDRNGDPLDDPTRFTDPNNAEKGPELSSHFFVDGYFKPSSTWTYGYTAMFQTDDTYLDRYGLDSAFESNGLFENTRRQNTTQAFIAGQGKNFRVSAVAAGFQSLNSRFVESETTGLINVTRDDNSVLPIIAPKIQGEYYVTDPALGGRARLFGDASYLTRETGSDYGRATAGLDYSKTWITGPGLEVKPFAWGRFDNYDIQTDSGTDIGFSRTIGQAGVDLRYPFIRRGGAVDLVIEPRALYTESFGDSKLDRFFDPVSGDFLFEDGATPDLDPALLFEPNKSDGFDFFQEGRRLDVGARVAAMWDLRGRESEVSIFAGRSYSDGVTDSFGPGSGLSGSNSEYIAALNLDLGGFLKSNTWVRYDEDRDVLSRIDSTLSANTKYVKLTGRYYKVNAPTGTTTIAGAPREEISGGITVRPFGGWSVGYRAVRDLGKDVTRSQQASIGYRDDCTLVELFYEKRDFDNDLIRNDSEFGIRLTLSTLGSFGGN
ncbi:LPS-assembly protein LptD [Algimonas arctica]|uniref:LPS-assembly protein LptD n=1 Tax=Algimonas arctica TaxID=1479486 RepID=A0A8J3CSJ5_9PROT|nr:LPS assembly protein LptD [Algimonas arctica]GHA99575.1 LPS-assembly protein LptD [Algimonas arctica]